MRRRWSSHPVWVCGLKHIIIYIDWKTHMSHPVWVCGLKLTLVLLILIAFLSHPVWVCGLKLVCFSTLMPQNLSHPVWVCGLKHWCLLLWDTFLGVTPCMGVWIETLIYLHVSVIMKSHPVWVCGLKHNFNNLIICQFRSWWFFIHYQQRNWQNRAIFLYLTPKLSGISEKIFKFAFKYNIL